MAMTMHVDIVSAEEEIFSGQATMLFAPAIMGEVGIMPRHAPLLTKIKPGEVRVITPADEELTYYVSGGMLEILPQGVTVLADTALRADDIDEAAAIAAKERAEKQLADRKDDIDYATAEAELAEAIAQIQTLKRIKKKLGR
ncbi:MAG: F0F1 ATP synthase subunit epsilon [Gammaproteobacteria bacterium]|nr:F0F1 ATP synthase subunit epsilon [Gammaproteobacteria bacterium]MDH5800222.1 F0F1 ATP synthase subunit epsilon [Gammaproteobacteria bacterium]